ncbi:MAG: hypothetical protein H0U57_14935 [Tatlockia sp.]|nr:hypothetical protein [Tatlockia sp.]
MFRLASRFIKLHQTLAKTIKGQSLSEDFYSDSDKIYQEFRIISGCPSLEDYKKLGQKNTLFANEKEQEWLYNAYTVYLKKLENSKSIHTPFHQLTKKNYFKRIVVDEAQDFSHLQLAALANLATDKQICYCEDNRQSLSDNKSKIPFLEKCFNLWGAGSNQVFLPSSYRCPVASVIMANAVTELKAMATDYGQQEIKFRENQIKGAVKWIEKLDNFQLSELQHLALSPDFAIVTSKENKEDAKQLFKTLLVFTPEEIKGLEYKNILAYRLLDNPLFKKADNIIGEKSSGFIKKSDNRAKRGQSREHLGLPFNAFYTACTRTTETLYVFQENHHYLKNIIEHLKKAIIKAPEISMEPALDSETIKEKWFNEVKLQLGEGNVEKAKEIYMEILGKTVEQFQELKNLFLEPVKPTLKENIGAIRSFDEQINHTNKCLENINEIPGDSTEYKNPYEDKATKQVDPSLPKKKITKKYKQKHLDQILKQPPSKRFFILYTYKG